MAADLSNSDLDASSPEPDLPSGSPTRRAMLGAPFFYTALDCAGLRKSLICNGHIFHLPLCAWITIHYSQATNE
jgi:hypothetical protein